MPIRHLVIGFSLLVAAVAPAACSNATTSNASIANGVNAMPAAGAATTTGEGKAASPSIVVGAPPMADVQRSVRAAYTVPSGSFLASFDGVIARAVALGGYVASSATRPAPGGRIAAGSVTLQVPSARLATLLNGMPSSFVASSIDFSSVDHYAAFVDVSAELVSTHAHLHALDALLANASTLGDITTLEQQIEAVQVATDTYQGELNSLTASVDMATATVALSERGATIVAAAPGPVNDGLTGGWHNAGEVTGTMLDGLITALPLLVIVVLAFGAWRLIPGWWRRTPHPLP